MDFEFFRCNILPPGNYAMWLKTDRSEPAESYIPYVLVYDTFSAICKKQRRIVENQEDAIALSAVFRRLPQLTELGLRFCQTLVQEHWVAFFMDQTVERHTYGHHLRIISNALKVGRDAGVFIRTVHLSGLELPYYCSLNTPKAQTLSIHLLDLLSCARNLCLSGSGSPMKSLSHTTLHLQRFDLCCLTVLQATLNEFLQNNMNSIESVGFHHVTLIGLGFTEEGSDVISPEMCRNSLRMDWSIMYWTNSPCLVCGHGGWRVSKSWDRRLRYFGSAYELGVIRNLEDIFGLIVFHWKCECKVTSHRTSCPLVWLTFYNCFQRMQSAWNPKSYCNSPFRAIVDYRDTTKNTDQG